VSTVVFFGIVPVGDITTLFLAPVVAFVLTMVVVAETLVAGYRALGDSRGPTGRLTERLADRPLYAAVRTLEAGLAVAAVAGFVALVAWIPDGPMAGPGAIGVFFVVLGPRRAGARGHVDPDSRRVRRLSQERHSLRES